MCRVPVPDYKMGWGVINAKTAAEIKSQRQITPSFIIERA